MCYLVVYVACVVECEADPFTIDIHCRTVESCNDVILLEHYVCKS